MITAKQVNELTLFKTPADGVLSCYLELAPGDTTASLVRRVERMSDRNPKSQALREDLDRIKAFLVDEFEPQDARAIAMFSSKKFGLWRACYLPEPVKDALVVDAAPALKPLTSVLDSHHRFGVALVGPKGARFFEVFLGRGREYEEHALVPAGREGAAFAKAVAEKLEGLSRNQAFKRVVVAVSEELSAALLGQLHTTIQQNLIVEPTLASDASLEDVVARIAACEAEARKVREAVLAHRLVDAAKTRGAVLGLDRTLEALQKGRVKVLYLRDGFAKMGRSCTSCGTLSIGWTKCQNCNSSTEAVFNLVGEMAARALALGCEVVRLMSETPLDNVGRIGAELLAPAAQTANLAADASAAAGASAAA